MFSKPLTTIVGLSAFATAVAALPAPQAQAQPAQGSSCASGVHIVVARASGELPGTGIIGNVAKGIQQKVPGSDIVSIEYPASLTPYSASESAGVKAMTEVVTQYAKDCPDTKMVLMGYSQGAHVTADVVCGASKIGFPTTQAINDSISDKVAAVVLMGDPSFVTGQSFNEGTGKNNGMFPRRNPQGCSAVASKMVSYCDSGDLFCSRGLTIGPHLLYVQKYGTDAIEFAVNAINIKN